MAQVCFLTRAGKIPLSSHLYTGASGTLGFGGIIHNQWFQGKWLPYHTLDTKNISIDWQELRAIVVASYVWASIVSLGNDDGDVEIMRRGLGITTSLTLGIKLFGTFGTAKRLRGKIEWLQYKKQLMLCT